MLPPNVIAISRGASDSQTPTAPSRC